MKILRIFKREKPIVKMPEPEFKDNWMQERYEKNVLEGIQSLQQGKSIEIMDDGRGYELALEIKHRFILEYHKQVSERIKIEKPNQSIITVKFLTN